MTNFRLDESQAASLSGAPGPSAERSAELPSGELAEAELMAPTLKRATAPRAPGSSRGSLGGGDGPAGPGNVLARLRLLALRVWGLLTPAEWGFAALLLLCYGFFIMPPETNTLSRWDMVYALAHGQATIDIHAKNTIDVSFRNGHYYSPRTLGLSLVATPVLWALGHLTNIDPPGGLSIWTQLDLMNLVTLVPVGIAAALVMRRFIVDLRPQLSGSPLPYVAAGAFALATLTYPFTTYFFSHAFGGGLLFIAFYLLYRARTARHPTRWLLAAGLLTGLGVISEYLAGVIFLILCGYILLAFVERRLRALIVYGVGIAPSALALALYNWWAFGDPLNVSYGFVTNTEFKGQHSGFFGVTLPRLSGLWEILVYPRGLLIESPFLLLLPLGFYLWYRSGVARLEALVAIAVAVIYPLLVSSYFLPMAGENLPGPRLLVPMLPFACLALGWLVDDARLWLRAALTVMLGFSLLITYLYLITGVRMFHTYGLYPWSSLYLPTLRTGVVPPYNGPTPDNYGVKLLHLPLSASIYIIALALALWFIFSARALLMQRRANSAA